VAQFLTIMGLSIRLFMAGFSTKSEITCGWGENRRGEERRGEERRREERRGEEEGGEERRREERSGEERRGEERTGEIKKQAVSWVESLQSFKGGSVKEFVALDFKSCFWTCMINRVRWHERGGLEKRKILEAKG
jgi:hypothetical protein